MGGGCYSSEDRLMRSISLGYHTKNIHEVFTQSAVRRVHESMDSTKIKFRESRDSEAHPNSLPIILGLDVTGSMLKIPHELIKDGLPTLMSNLIEHGVADASLLFLAVGDHECDSYPLQIGQFESGDAELDLWLTRTYLESGGGGNGGESYLLSWYFAAFHTETDAFSKRKEKGFLFTVGDEPNLKTLPKAAIQGIIMDSPAEKSYTEAELLAAAQEKYNVYHLIVNHSMKAQNSIPKWKELLGQNCVVVDDYRNVGKIVAQIVLDNSEKQPANLVKPIKKSVSKPEEVIL